MCVYPKLIKNPRYKANMSNGGVIPPLHDRRMLWIPAECGKCRECRKKKARNWNIRLKEELRETKLKGEFMTYTFSPEALADLTRDLIEKGIRYDGYELDNEIARLAVRRYLERWRKKYKKSLRHWFVTEIGPNNTERMHIHGIVWYDPKKIDKKDLIDIWGYGRADIGKKGVSEASVGYLVKYLHKPDIEHKTYNPKLFVSPGLGAGYLKRPDAELNKFKGPETWEVYTARDGKRMDLPEYYRRKIYDDQERNELWIHKLDKQERWVDGQRIDVSTEEGLRIYEKALKYAQNENVKMGYPDNSVYWKRKKYERQIRNLKKLKELESMTDKEKYEANIKMLKDALKRAQEELWEANDANLKERDMLRRAGPQTWEENIKRFEGGMEVWNSKE